MMDNPTSLPVTAYPNALPQHLVDEITSVCRGPMYLPDDPNFKSCSTIFNSTIQTCAKAVIRPFDASDVSKILVWCTKHALSPSIKAGGYGVAGWAIGGDVIVDLSALGGVDIEVPRENGSFTGTLKLINPTDLSTTAQVPGSNPSPNGVASPGQLPTSVSEDLAATNPSSPSGTIPSFSSLANPSSSTTRAGADPFAYLDNPDGFPSAAPAALVQSFRNTHAAVVLRPSSSRSYNAPGPLAQASIQILAKPLHPHAFVTFGAGVRQMEVDEFTDNHRLPAIPNDGGGIPYHVPFAAHPVGSSIMLLGGFGFLSRLHGLSVDNLVEVEMVLADGRIVVVNKNEHPDLWWALRGAGPAFGVATRYKAKAFPLPVVFAGNLLYHFNKSTAPSLLKHFRDCVKSAPRELYANLLLTAGPPGEPSIIVIQMCFIGPKEKGQAFLDAFASWDGGKCELVEVHEKSFLSQLDSVARVLSGEEGREWYIRSALITSLPDDIINNTVTRFTGAPVGCTWMFELAGGAISDFEDTAIPKSQREAAFTVVALHQLDVNADAEIATEAAEEWIFKTLAPVHIGGPFPCFLGRNEPSERTIACFGDNWGRLVEIKDKYDPGNLFRNTFWPGLKDGDPK